MTNGKKTALLWLSAALVTLLVSCATTNQSPGGKPELLVRGEIENPRQLGKNDFLAVTKNIDNPQYLDVSRWSKVRILTDLLDVIRGHTDFTKEEKYELLSFLFDELPLNGEDGVMREVYIGKYFDNQDPLIVRIAVFEPLSKAKAKNEKVIVMLSNLIRLPDGSFNKTAGAFVGLEENAGLACSLFQRLLTTVEKMQGDAAAVGPAALGSLEKVMLAQAYLADEKPANDAEADRMVSDIIAKNTDMPAVIIMAMLMKYDYLLSQEDITAAEKLWGEILVYSHNVPGDMNPETLEPVNGASLYLMKRLVQEK